MFNFHVAKLLTAYCQNELPEQELQRVQTHLQACTRCQHAYEEIKFGIALAQQITPVEAPDSLWLAVIKQNVAPTTKAKFRFNWQMATVALLIVLLVGWFGFTRLRNRELQFVADVPQVQFGPVAMPPVTKDPQEKKVVAIVTPTPKSKTPSVISPTKKIDSPAWEVASLEGAPKVGATKINGTEKLSVGEWLETDNNSRAKIKVANIGFVDIDPNSRVQLVKTQNTEHRIALTKGKLSALILAPPRLFVVDTPSATAVDLGCAYTLEVDEAGNSLLHVTSGWVSFVLPSGKNGSRESFIPAGAMCATRKGAGVGTPYFADASAAFKSTLQKMDFGGEVSITLITTILAEARKRDALTLWHLLDQAKWQPEWRGQIYDRLVELAPPPSGITRAGILQNDRKMLDRWWEEKIQ